MQVNETLFGSQVANYTRSLGRTTVRQSLLGNNLANVNVPGYKRKDVGFAIELEGAEAGAGSAANHIWQQLGGTGDGIRTDYVSIRMDGNSVDLEQEVMSIAETELRYNMLTEMTGRYFSGLQSVIRGNGQ